MNFKFTDSDINNIENILNSNPKKFENSWQWQIKKADNTKPLVLSVHNNVKLGEGLEASMISVQTQHGFYELHNIDGYIIFEPDEIFFLKSYEETVSALIVGKECTCSLFSGVRKELLNSDFSELDPAVLLSAMQLSVTESELSE